MIKPRKLEPGMTIGLIAPASAAPTSKTDLGIENLKKLGYKIKEGRSIRERWGYLAASDKARIDDIHRMFADKTVDAILCVRGGYGTTRLLPHLDYDLIKSNPKILCGFSDITALQLAILRKTQLVTFSGPVLTFTFGRTKPTKFTTESFFRTLGESTPSGSIWDGHYDHEFRTVTKGDATGKLVGGNLSLVAATVGTEYEIDTKGKIVFLEDIDEKNYSYDRMLTTLIQNGKLVDAAAIVFGRNVPHPKYRATERAALAQRPAHQATPMPTKVDRTYEPTIDEVIADRLGKLGIPVMIGLPFGHIPHYATIPQGVKASISTKTGDLIITESAVS